MEERGRKSYSEGEIRRESERERGREGVTKGKRERVAKKGN